MARFHIPSATPLKITEAMPYAPVYPVGRGYEVMGVLSITLHSRKLLHQNLYGPRYARGEEDGASPGVRLSL